jgi:WXG100 family type VII secretion target
MAAKFAVETEVVEKAIVVMTEKANALTTMAKTLEDEVSSLSLQWKGNAAAQFNAELSQYQQTLIDMANITKNFTEQMRSALYNYRKADEVIVHKLKDGGTLTVSSHSIL